MKSKKIAHIQVIPQLTGVQQVSLDILSGLSDKYEKYIIFGGSYDVSDEFLAKFANNNINIIFVPSLKREIGLHDITATKELFKLFKKEKFDIIHTNSTKPGVVARLAAKLIGCPLIVHTIHGIAYHKFEKLSTRIFYYVIDAFFALFSDHLICVNNCYLKYYPFIKNKSCIYNSVEMDASLLSSAKEHKGLRLGYMARLDPQKDPLTLLKAIKYGLDEKLFSRCDLKVCMAGEGELSIQCQEYIESNELNDVITLIGWVSNKQEFYSAIDVFCLPSIFEAFGLVFLEAAHFNIPSIATHVEGIPEVVIDNKTGLLVAPKDYKNMAKKILLYINSPELVTIHGINAKQRMKQHFSKEEMLTKYDHIYQSR